MGVHCVVVCMLNVTDAGSGLCVCMIFSIYVIIANVNKDLNIDMIERIHFFIALVAVVTDHV